MNNIALFLFIFLLLGYILFSFLGRSMIEGMISTNPGVYPTNPNPFGFSDSSTNNKDRKIPNIPLKFYGTDGANPIGATARIELTNKENDYDKIHITTIDPITKNEITNTFINQEKHDPNNLNYDILMQYFKDGHGNFAKIDFNFDDGYQITASDLNGTAYLYLNDKPPSSSPPNNKDIKTPNIPLNFYGTDGATARIELTTDRDKIHITRRDPITKNEITSTFIGNTKNIIGYKYDITNVIFSNYLGETAQLSLRPDNSYEIRVKDISLGTTTLILEDKPSSPSPSPHNNTKTSNNQYDNYNHYNKQSTPNIPVLFYGRDGATARIDLTNEENGYDKIHTNMRNISKTFTSSVKHNPYNLDYDITKVPFKDTEGNSANVILGSDNSYSIKIIDSLGRTNLILNDTNNQLPFEEETKEIIGIFTPINSSFSSSSSSSNDYYSKGNNFDNYVPEKELKLPSYDYSGSLPPGISKQMIPKGDEDLYILKTQIVPPVCPVCPACHSATTLSSSSAPGSTQGSSSNPASESASGSSSNPAFGSAPGSSSNPAFGSGSGSGFETGFGSSSSSFPSSGSSSSFMKNDEPLFGNKKISNYKNINSEYLPMPVLSSFSSFGM